MNRIGIDIFPATTLADCEVADSDFPSRLTCWHSGDCIAAKEHLGPSGPRFELQMQDNGTHFGFVNSGCLSLEVEAGVFQLSRGMYFSIPGAARLSGQGSGFAATRIGYRGFFHMGGPVEERGRLEYIDGCSDSLLISPVVLGDPCLNLLYLPPHTQQTEHTHPSCRLGMIAGGRGICRSPYADFDLTAGMVFNIAPDARHSFHTGQDSLSVIAWHPDSDFGPAHRDHPMINRTIIDGVSAADRIPLNRSQGIAE